MLITSFSILCVQLMTPLLFIILIWTCKTIDYNPFVFNTAFDLIYNYIFINFFFHKKAFTNAQPEFWTTYSYKTVTGSDIDVGSLSSFTALSSVFCAQACSTNPRCALASFKSNNTCTLFNTTANSYAVPRSGSTVFQKQLSNG
jgi:hypothetical protein